MATYESHLATLRQDLEHLRARYDSLRTQHDEVVPDYERLKEAHRQTSAHAVLSTIALGIGALLAGDPDSLDILGLSASEASVQAFGWGVLILGGIMLVATQIIGRQKTRK